MPRLSVIVPCYKVESDLPQCIESILGQSFKDLELILVDDGSPDKSGAICDAYAAKDTRVTVIHKPNGGVSAARNDGLDRAKGEFVIFVDSDDWVPPDAYETMLCKADESNADIMVGDVVKVFKDKEEYCQFYDKDFTVDDKKSIDGLIRADFYKNYCPNPPPSGPAFGYGGPWNKIVRKDLLLRNNIRFDVRVKGLFDDIIYTAYILANAKRVSYMAKPVYYYRILETSITQTYKPDMPAIAEAILASFSEFIGRHGPNGEFDKAFAALAVRMLGYALPRYYCNRKNGKSFFARAAELRGVMNLPLYSKAARDVELRLLTPRQKYLALLLRCKAAIPMMIAYGTK